MNSTYKTIHDVFERFQKDRHNEDKGRNFNLLQEIFAKAELFDVSKLEVGKFPKHEMNTSNGFMYLVDKNLARLSLPFEALFIHIEDRQYYVNNTLLNSSTYMFIREYNPTHITGTIYEVSDEGRRNLPFTVTIEVPSEQIEADVNDSDIVEDSNNFIVEAGGFDNKEDLYNIGILNINEVEYKLATPRHYSIGFYSPQEVLSLIYNTLSCIDSLNSKTIIADVPTTNRTIYYRRKGSPAIKVPARSIYYVINRHDTESEKHIEFTGTKVISHAFKVRGHWRTLENSEALGKDRQGNRIVKGFTWVTEYIKGDENNLVKKVRIIE